MNAAPSIFGAKRDETSIGEFVTVFQSFSLNLICRKPTIEKEGRRQGRKGPDLSTCDDIFRLKIVIMNEMKWVKMK